jgi:teichuronic acid biosynthesis glycosyltransferase TuaH
VDREITYFMHIPWNWIKQRPQFIAEELSNYFSIKIIYQQPYISTGLNQTESIHRNIEIFKYLSIPFKGRIKLFQWLNTYFIRIQLKLFGIIKSKSLIWITHPEMYPYIPSTNLTNPIIYDCMDDVLEFPSAKNNAIHHKKLLLLEKKLCLNSKIIFCSSHYLKYKLINRYNLDSNKITVVNNGINLQNLMRKKTLPKLLLDFFSNRTKKIVYIGTISEWFDFDLVMYSLEKINNIEYLLFGPTEVTIPYHNRIRYCGSIEHEYVSAIMNMADVLVMPFILNELIKSVNPVKAYEYIFSSKPALLVQYEETEKFSDYLYLYKSHDDYVNQLVKIIDNHPIQKIADTKKEKFIYSSTWAGRSEEIYNIMSNQLRN